MKELLSKYIAGETDEKETEEIERWLEEDPEHFREFERLWDLWHTVSTATNLFRFDVDKGWKALMEKRAAAENGDLSKNSARRNFFKKIVIISGSMAAVMLVLIGTGLWWKMSDKHVLSLKDVKDISVSEVPKEGADSFSYEKNRIIISTAPGQQKKLRLSDGSVVWLNSNTTIRYDNENNAARILYLSGQAFFDISHDPEKPFIVKTDHATIKVLGTRFDVTAYPRDPVTEAVLTQGSIMFTTEADNRKISKHLIPGEKVTMNYLSGRLNISEVDTSFYSSWKEGVLLFRDETFADVATAMEHKYNITITFRDTSLRNKKLNGYLQKESLQEALKALQLTLQFDYTIIGNKVIIYP
ncbi:MAG: DUF4974 domain-containing protein [Chitinophagaceae bacterium]|nr:MAG: DUF4974 domain-containing protein [Chitinophagaceae bacterium]